MSSVALQALKMRYFSNRPGPTPGPQLPRPNCSVEALREKETVGLKRKIEGLDTSKQAHNSTYSLQYVQPTSTTLTLMHPQSNKAVQYRDEIAV